MADKKKITEKQWAHIFEHWIKKAVESFQPEKIVCKRSSAIPGNFVKGIVEDLDSSELVIADLTGSKPNVYYELGVRHALRTGTILITQDFKALPSDLTNYYVFEYDYSEIDHEYAEHFAKFEKQMHEKIQAWTDTNNPSDSPVSDFLKIINQRLEKELEQEREELKNIFAKLKEHFTHNFEVCEFLLARMKHDEPKENERLTVVDVFAIDTIYLRLVAYNWKHIKGDLLIRWKKLLSINEGYLTKSPSHGMLFAEIQNNPD
jgi:gas vesicle protein